MPKDDEIHGASGTSYTAEFWQYDPRICRRWNLDPVTKPWQSSFTAFSNSPISRVDPNGDDDYYNEKGQWIKTIGDNNGIVRIIKQKTYDDLVKANSDPRLFSPGLSPQIAEANSNVVEVQTTAAQMAVFAALEGKTAADGKESGARVILDVEKFKLSIVEDTDAERFPTLVVFSDVWLDKDGGSTTYADSRRTKVILSHIHTHPQDPDIRGDGIITIPHGPSTSGPNNDIQLTQRDGRISFVLDQDLFRVTPATAITKLDRQNANVPLDALQSTGGKPQ